jgi:hypothetical protein
VWRACSLWLLRLSPGMRSVTVHPEMPGLTRLTPTLLFEPIVRDPLRKYSENKFQTKWPLVISGLAQGPGRFSDLA